MRTKEEIEQELQRLNLFKEEMLEFSRFFNDEYSLNSIRDLFYFNRGKVNLLERDLKDMK